MGFPGDREPSPVSVRPPRERTAILKIIGEEYNCHMETVRRYISFGRQLDRLEEKMSGIRVRILTGDLIVQMGDMPALVRIPADRLEILALDRHNQRLTPPPEFLPRDPGKSPRTRNEFKVEPGIKQMPKYDPDADLNGLRYTVGAWRKAISLTTEKADFAHATKAGKEDLRQTLEKLIREACGLCMMLEDKQDD